MRDSQDNNYYVLLAGGLITMILPGLINMSWGDGAATIMWITAFIVLASEYRTRKQLLITGAAFCIGFFLKFAGATGMLWLNLTIFVPFGIILYCVFVGYGYAVNRWQSVLTTTLFPVTWMTLYEICTLLRFPSIVRIDVMFIDMQTIIQSEKTLGSFGLSFMILWFISLLHYTIKYRKTSAVIIAMAVAALVFSCGMFNLYSNYVNQQTVRIAYTTGPYGGDFITYEPPTYEESLASMKKSVKEAAGENASILVFNEEAFELKDSQEKAFLKECRNQAEEYGIHILVGLDLADTDGSNDGDSENKIVWIDRHGKLLGSYLKSKLIPVIESGYVAGDGVIPSHTITVDNVQIKVAYAICYDSNFPEYIKQIDDDTDILFLPSWDWKAITNIHAKLCSVIAVENDTSILKPTYDGISIAVSHYGEILARTSTDDVGFETVQVVEMPVHSGEHLHPVTIVRSPFTYAIIAAEIFSLLVCFILLYGNYFENSNKSDKNRAYSALVFMTAVALVSDGLSWILDGCQNLSGILFGTTLLSMTLSFIIIAGFVNYLVATIGEQHNISPLPRDIYYVMCAIFIVITCIGCYNGSLITFVNGYYNEGPLYTAYVIISALSSVFCLALLFVYRKSMSLHTLVSACIYIAIPTLSAMINAFYENWAFTYPAIVLSLVAIYVLLQSEHATKLEADREISNYYAIHDQLTDLYNRRACDNKIEELITRNTNIGVIFGDLNGLKLINDIEGHAAGDNLIKKFSVMLTEAFRKDELYRISGDEFIILLENVSEDVFHLRFSDFEELLEMDDVPIACVASAYGKSSDVINLVRIAESRMYKKKQAFHKKHPEMNR